MHQTEDPIRFSCMLLVTSALQHVFILKRTLKWKFLLPVNIS